MARALKGYWFMQVTDAGAHVLRWAIRPIGCFLLGLSTAYAAGWVSRTPANSPDSALCPVLLHRLNNTPPSCIATAVGAFPGFTSPPWKTVDAAKHLELIAKLTAYGGSPLDYFRAPMNNLAGRVEAAREFVQAGGTLKIWQTRLLTYFGSDLEDPSPPGDQTIALLSSKLWSPDCPAYAGMYRSQTFVVLPDLNGPDPRVKQGVASLLANSYPVSYRGQTLLVSQYLALARLGAGKDKLYDGDQVMIYHTVRGVSSFLCWFWFSGNDRNYGEKRE